MVVAVASPRNHFYRTSIGLLCQAFRASKEAHHIGNLADKLDFDAIFSGFDADALDHAARNLKRLHPCPGIGERLLEVGNPPPIEVRQTGMELGCRLWRRGNLILKASLVPLRLLKPGLKARGAESVSDCAIPEDLFPRPASPKSVGASAMQVIRPSSIALPVFGDAEEKIAQGKPRLVRAAFGDMKNNAESSHAERCDSNRQQNMYCRLRAAEPVLRRFKVGRRPLAK